MLLRTLTLAVASALIALTGCSSDATTDQEEDMTPDAALANMRKASKDLLAAAVPQNEFVEVPAQDVPCGGLGGNEWSKIKYSYEAAAGTSDAPEAVLAAAEDALPDLGLSNKGRGTLPAGPSLVFAGEGFGARLLVHVEGAVMVLGSTDCLDNPDR